MNTPKKEISGYYILVKQGGYGPRELVGVFETLGDLVSALKPEAESRKLASYERALTRDHRTPDHHIDGSGAVLSGYPGSGYIVGYRIPDWLQSGSSTAYSWSTREDTPSPFFVYLLPIGGMSPDGVFIKPTPITITFSDGKVMIRDHDLRLVYEEQVA